MKCLHHRITITLDSVPMPLSTLDSVARPLHETTRKEWILDMVLWLSILDSVARPLHETTRKDWIASCGRCLRSLVHQKVVTKHLLKEPLFANMIETIPWWRIRLTTIGQCRHEKPWAFDCWSWDHNNSANPRNKGPTTIRETNFWLTLGSPLKITIIISAQLVLPSTPELNPDLLAKLLNVFFGLGKSKKSRGKIRTLKLSNMYRNRRSCPSNKLANKGRCWNLGSYASAKEI